MKERRKDKLRRLILDIISDPVLKLYARKKKDPKEIAVALHLSAWQVRKRLREFIHMHTATK